MRYYSTSRPIMPDGYPKSLNPVNIVNFEEKTYCEEIGMDAWGYIEFKSCISEEEAEAWGFIMAGTRTWYCVTSAFFDDGRVTANITGTKISASKPEGSSKSLSRKDVYTDWMDSREEAEGFIREARAENGSLKGSET